MDSRLINSVFILVLSLGSWSASSDESPTSTPQPAHKNELSQLNQTTRLHLKHDEITQALSTALKAVGLSKETDSAHDRQQALFNLGVIYSIRGEAGSSINALRKSTQLAEELGDARKLAISLLMLGSAYGDSGDYNEALKAYGKSLKLYESSNNLAGVAKALNNIADSYDKQGDYAKTREYLMKALEINRQQENRKGIALQLLNLGNLDKKEGNYKQALVSLNEALIIHRSIEAWLRTAQTLTELAKVHFHLQEFELSYARSQEAHQISSDRGFQKELFEILILIARTQIELGNLDLADTAFQNASLIADEIKLKKEFARLLKVSSLIKEKQGAYQNALTDYKQHHELLLSELKQESSRTTKEMYARFDTDRKESEIALLNKEKLLQDITLRQQQASQKRMLTVLLTVILFSLVLLWLVHINRRAKRVIEKQNRELSDAFLQVEALAQQDYLTQLLNRRGFSNLMEYEFHRQKRNQQSVVFILCDIDHFKQINDTHGHDCGDQVLINVARFFEKMIREQDTLCRWGGEEFLMMLPKTNLEDGLQLAERLRTHLHQQAFDCGMPPLFITATFGVSACRQGKAPSDCIKQADQALYTGKERGRNQVIVAE